MLLHARSQFLGVYRDRLLSRLGIHCPEWEMFPKHLIRWTHLSPDSSHSYRIHDLGLLRVGSPFH